MAIPTHMKTRNTYMCTELYTNHIADSNHLQKPNEDMERTGEMVWGAYKVTTSLDLLVDHQPATSALVNSRYQWRLRIFRFFALFLSNDWLDTHFSVIRDESLKEKRTIAGVVCPLITVVVALWCFAVRGRRHQIHYNTQIAILLQNTLV